MLGIAVENFLQTPGFQRSAHALACTAQELRCGASFLVGSGMVGNVIHDFGTAVAADLYDEVVPAFVDDLGQSQVKAVCRDRAGIH